MAASSPTVGNSPTAIASPTAAAMKSRIEVLPKTTVMKRGSSPTVAGMIRMAAHAMDKKSLAKAIRHPRPSTEVAPSTADAKSMAAPQRDTNRVAEKLHTGRAMIRTVQGISRRMNSHHGTEKKSHVTVVITITTAKRADTGAARRDIAVVMVDTVAVRAMANGSARTMVEDTAKVATAEDIMTVAAPSLPMMEDMIAESVIVAMKPSGWSVLLSRTRMMDVHAVIMAEATAKVMAEARAMVVMKGRAIKADTVVAGIRQIKQTYGLATQFNVLLNRE